DGVPVCNTTTKRVTILDLVSGETYEFKVVAHNLVGNGEMSAPVSFTAGDEVQEDDGEGGSDAMVILLAAGAVLAIVALMAIFFIVKRRGKG
ncbi:MAG TPA: fibronectin type III domain-containing protein, partial [Methanomassiliicoccales archaeon]|nr:fibronectin type III domain-containing protein [Methanomassiliicoccales archaeon]